MRYFKRGDNRFILLAISIITVIVLILLSSNKPSITGKVVQSQVVYSENLNLRMNESGTYEWKVKNPGDIKSIKASGDVSSNGTVKVYIEKNGTRQLLFDSSKQLFDVDIDVLPEYKKISPGEKILVQIKLFNLRGFGSGNVSINYFIQNSKGNLIAAEEEVVFVETQAEFIREFVVPDVIKPGNYLAFVEAYTNTTLVGTSSDAFEVTGKYKYPSELGHYLFGFAVTAALIVIFILMRYWLGILNKKQRMAELKGKVPIERAQKLEKELKALEEGYKAKLISEVSYKNRKSRIENRLRISRK